MSVQKLQPPVAILWQPEPAMLAETPDPVLLSWLTDTGLLTPRIRRLCANNFRLEVLAEDVTPATDVLRRVLLCCGDLPCVYAETFLPAKTNAAHPWLRSLGSEPLGEALRSRIDVRRGRLEYALLAPAHLPATVDAGQATMLWARRSTFTISRATLTVTEVFLPGVVECASRAVSHGEFDKGSEQGT